MKVLKDMMLYEKKRVCKCFHEWLFEHVQKEKQSPAEAILAELGKLPRKCRVSMVV